jgi:hypothetical protein
MRAGRLKTAATLRSSAGVELGAQRLIGIEDKDSSITFGEGLKSNAAITIRSRWNSDIAQGNFWLAGTRLFLINGMSNPDGCQRDAVCSCTELVGAPTLISDTGDVVKCALTSYRAKPQGEHDYLSAGTETERRQAEFVTAQYSPVIGHEFILAGAVYRIIEHDTDNSDLVVSRVWVEFLRYETD